jgi:hypothetical protein
MNRLSPIPTTPSSLKDKGYVMDTRPLWLCGHQHRHGQRRGGVFYKCAECAKGKK